MACKAHTSNEDNDDMPSSSSGDSDRITFLYKFIEGECPRSFGMNVAHMAGLPKQVMLLAKSKSHEFNEKMSHMLKQGGQTDSAIKAAANLSIQR